MLLQSSSILLVLSLARCALALNCNICGPGTNNIMTNHLGVVVINYEGVDYRQNCQKWQESKLISEEWCEENMLRLTFDICKCMTAQGALVRDLMTEAPTESPPEDELPTVPDVAPVSAPTTTTQASSPSGSSLPICISGAVVGVIASTIMAI